MLKECLYCARRYRVADSLLSVLSAFGTCPECRERREAATREGSLWLDDVLVEVQAPGSIRRSTQRPTLR